MHQVGFYYIDVKSCFVIFKNCEKQYFGYLCFETCSGENARLTELTESKDASRRPENILPPL